MSQKVSNIALVRDVYLNTIDVLKNKRSLYFPFIIFALFEFLAILVAYLSPRAPLISIIGPLIRTLFGESFLHYPLNFILLPKLATHARIGLSLVLGSLLTGTAVFMIWDNHNKKRLSLFRSLKSAIKKYVSFLIITLIVICSFYLFIKLVSKGLTLYFLSGHRRLLYINANIWMGPILAVINFMISVLVQSALVYAIPLLVIENEKLIKAIGKSFVLFKRYFFPTIILVTLPMLFYIPIIILQYNSVFLISKVFPEFILLVCFLSTIISSLFIDPLITISTAHLYLIKRKK